MNEIETMETCDIYQDGITFIFYPNGEGEILMPQVHVEVDGNTLIFNMPRTRQIYEWLGKVLEASDDHLHEQNHATYTNHPKVVVDNVYVAPQPKFSA